MELFKAKKGYHNMEQRERFAKIEIKLGELATWEQERRELTHQIYLAKEEMVKLVIKAKLVGCLSVDTRRLKQAFRRAI